MSISPCLGACEVSGARALPPSTCTSTVPRPRQQPAIPRLSVSRDGKRAKSRFRSREPTHEALAGHFLASARGLPSHPVPRSSPLPPKASSLHPILLWHHSRLLPIPDSTSSPWARPSCAWWGGCSPDTGQSPPMPWGGSLRTGRRGRCLCRKERGGGAAYPAETALDGHLYGTRKQLLHKIPHLSYSSSIATVKITPTKFYIRWIKRNSAQ